MKNAVCGQPGGGLKPLEKQYRALRREVCTRIYRTNVANGGML